MNSEFQTVASSSQPDDQAHTASTPTQSGDSPAPPQITSQELFRGRQEIEICHEGESYRLRITKNGKLILHK